MPKYKEKREVEIYIQSVAHECRVEGGQHAPDHILEWLLARWFDICGVTRSIRERGNVVVELSARDQSLTYYVDDGLFYAYPGELVIDKLARLCVIVRSGPALSDPENKNVSEGIVKWVLLVEMLLREEAKLVVKGEKAIIKLKGVLLEQLQGPLSE